MTQLGKLNLHWIHNHRKTPKLKVSPHFPLHYCTFVILKSIAIYPDSQVTHTKLSWLAAVHNICLVMKFWWLSCLNSIKSACCFSVALLPILVCRCTPLRSKFFISECVRYIAEEIVKPWLGNLCSKVVYSGSHYDGTGLPGKDDFDCQMCINLPGKVSSQDLDISTFAGVVGGPSYLCDGSSKFGLSIDVVCNMIIFTICSQLNWFW